MNRETPLTRGKSRGTVGDEGPQKGSVHLATFTAVVATLVLGIAEVPLLGHDGSRAQDLIGCEVERELREVGPKTRDCGSALLNRRTREVDTCVKAALRAHSRFIAKYEGRGI